MEWLTGTPPSFSSKRSELLKMCTVQGYGWPIQVIHQTDPRRTASSPDLATASNVRADFPVVTNLVLRELPISQTIQSSTNPAPPPTESQKIPS